MSKKLSILFFSTILLVACQNQNAAVNTGDSASSEAASSVAAMEQSSSVAAMPSADNDAAVWAMMGAWNTDIAWTAPAAGTNSDEIRIDADHSIPAGMMQTIDVTATMTADEYSKTFIQSREALTTAAQEDGWMPMITMDADGPTGTVWAYKKDTTAGVRFLLIEATGTDCGTDKDAPVQCAKFNAKVSLTSALGEGDDL